MNILILGLVVFMAAHLLPTAPAWHQAARLRLGEQRYKGVYSLVSLIGFVIIIVGMGRAEFSPVWEPPAWGRAAAAVLMALALYCLAAKSLKSNLKRVTAHPMLWGITFWSSGHLLSNGDLASALLFGSFLAYSLFDMWSANRRGARPSGEAASVFDEAKLVAISAVAYLLLAFAHPWIAGVPLMP